MIALLSMAGSLVAPWLLKLAPWGGPKAALMLAALLGALLVIGGPAGAVWLSMRSEVARVRIIEREAYEHRISEMERRAAQNLGELMARIANEVEEAPMTTAQEREECKKSRLCRSGK